MALSERIRKRLIEEGLNSYLDAKHCLRAFEQLIEVECTNVLRSHIDELRKKTGVPFRDKTDEHQGSDSDGIYMGVGVPGKKEDDYICVGLWWESGTGVISAYASRYVGTQKKLANSLFEKLRRYGLEKEESQKEGWYFSVYKDLAPPDVKNVKESLNAVLRVWMRIGTQFDQLRSKYRQ